MSTDDTKPANTITSRQVEVHATPQQVWQAIATGAGNAGWLFPALQLLRAYVPDFLGQPVAGVGVTADTGRPLADRSALSADLLGALNLIGLQAGDKYRAPDDAPPLTGILANGEEDGAALSASSHGCVLRTDEPGPGIFEISTFSMDGQTVTVNVVGRLYGDGGPALADRDEPRWVDWLTRHFPAVTPTTIPR